MNKEQNNHLLEYTSLISILSYFVIHNIFLVLIGITISLYFINIDFITRLVKSTNKIISNEKVSRESNDNDQEVKTASKQKKLINKDYKLTLVETIEEIGYIPSLNKKY